MPHTAGFRLDLALNALVKYDFGGESESQLQKLIVWIPLG